MEPWKFHSDLTEDRLIKVGELLLEARNAVAARYDPTGDDSWSQGCAAHSWCRHAILREARNPENGWLKIIDDSRRFIFRIGDVPVRFFRSESDLIPERFVDKEGFEREQISLSFPDEYRVFQLVWRFIIRPDELGDVKRIEFVGATSNGISECVWNIPIDHIPLNEIDNSIDVLIENDVDVIPSPKVSLPKREEAANE